MRVREKRYEETVEKMRKEIEVLKRTTKQV